MSNIARSGTRLLAFGVLLLSAPSVLGQAILSDYFSGSNLASISGRTPDGADLPGSTWTATNLNGVGAGYISTGTGNSAPSVFGGQNADFTINISSSGGYTKPAALTLSLDVKLNTIYDDYAANHVPVRGIGLGFFSSTGGGTVEASIPFTGLTVYPDGRLRLVVNGVAQSTTVDASAGFATANFCNLTYSIDTVTGGITSVVFNSNDYTSTFSGVTTAFTPSLTNLTGFYVSSGGDTSHYGYADNFTVSAIPEPSTYAALFGLTALGFAAYRRRHRQAG